MARDALRELSAVLDEAMKASTRLSWAWEYAFGAEEAARTAPPIFLTAVERKAAELVRAAEAQYLHGRAYGARRRRTRAHVPRYDDPTIG
ncbi:hypothetical protein [Streptomyces tendae]|uniref:hypothetical protein n=1 Tax=Streptomyces tendae TaxID=1932 RepID=UPI00364FEAF6